MLSVRLVVKSRLLIVKLLGNQKLDAHFQPVQGCVAQGSTVLTTLTI